MASNATRQTVGRNIRRARDDAGWTQHKLAIEIGARADQVSKWEAGLHRPSDDYLIAIGAKLGHPLAWFFASNAEPEPVEAA